MRPRFRWLGRRAHRGARIGAGCAIARTATLDGGEHIRLGAGVRILRHTEVLGKPGLPVVLGDGVYVNQGCLIRPGVTIGAQTHLGPRVMLLSDGHEIGGSQRRAGRAATAPISIGAGCWIGAGTIVLGGVTIADGCVLGAGSVVTRDCLPDAVYAGVPARLVRRLEP